MGTADQALLKIQDKADNVLGQNGVISQKLQNYEFRAEQLQMAKAIGEAIEDDGYLMVEAGTGVGMSFPGLTLESRKAEYSL